MHIADQFNYQIFGDPISLRRLGRALSQVLGKKVVFEHKKMRDGLGELMINVDERSRYISPSFIKDVFKSKGFEFSPAFDATPFQKLIVEDYYQKTQWGIFQEPINAFQLKADLPDKNLRSYLKVSFEDYVKNLNLNDEIKSELLDEMVNQIQNTLSQSQFKTIASAYYQVSGSVEAPHLIFKIGTTRPDFRRIGLQKLLKLILITLFKAKTASFVSLYKDGYKFVEGSGLMRSLKLYRDDWDTYNGVVDETVAVEFAQNPEKYILKNIKSNPLH